MIDLSDSIQRIAFDNTLIDKSTREIFYKGQVREVEPMAFNLLVFLVGNRGRVVSREELQNHVWQGCVVSDAAMARVVMKARKVLSDDAKQQRYIKTIHGIGYRFVAEVQFVSADQSDESAGNDSIETTVITEAPISIKRNNLNSMLRMLIGLVLLAALAVGLVSNLNNPAFSHQYRVVVLPVSNQTQTDSLEWISLGLMGLANQLIQKKLGIYTVEESTVLSILHREVSHNETPATSSAFLSTMQEVYAVSHYLSMTVTSDNNIYTLSYSVFEQDGLVIKTGMKKGEDLVDLMQEILPALSEALDIITGQADVDDYIPGDPFLSEAFSRGMSLKLEGKAYESIRFFRLVADEKSHMFWPKYENALALHNASLLEESLQILEELKERQLSDKESSALNHLFGKHYWRSKNGELAMQHLSTGFAQAQAVNDLELQWRILVTMSIAVKGEGQLEEGTRLLGRALTIAKEIGYTSPPCNISNSLAASARRLGRLGEAESGFIEAQKCFRLIGDKRYESTSTRGLANVLRVKGKYIEAEETIRKAIQISSEIDDFHGYISAKLVLMWILKDTGKYNQAYSVMTELESEVEPRNNPLYDQWLTEAKYQIMDALGRTQEAEDVLSDYRVQVSKTGNDLKKLQLELTWAEMRYQHTGEFSEENIQQLLNTAKQRSLTFEVIHATRLLGAYFADQKQYDLSIEYFKKAESLSITSNNFLKTVRIQLELVKNYLALNDIESTAAKIGEMNRVLPENFEVLLANGFYYSAIGERELAKENFQSAKLIGYERWTENEEQHLLAQY
jgi:DNA-binding winged helix-turn-helix (wHTH) protein/tetratricopeptide (TPR) repeat protein